MAQTTTRYILIAVLAAAVIGIVLWNYTGGSDLYTPAGNTGKQGSTDTGNDTGKTTVQWFTGPTQNYIYMVTVIAPQGGHVITGEYLLNNLKGMKEWKFSQYENMDIQPGDWQMPYGNATQKTLVEIHKVTNLSVVGGSDLVYDGEVFPSEFFIDDKGTVTSDGNIAPKDCFTGVPLGLAGKIVLLKGFGQFGISNCSADPAQQVFTLTIFDNNDPVAVSQFQSHHIEGWSVEVNTDTDLEQSILRTHNRLYALKADRPELKIAAYDLIVDSRNRPVQKIAEVFVSESTPDNQKLNGTEIDGWKIRVLELYENKRGKAL